MFSSVRVLFMLVPDSAAAASEVTPPGTNTSYGIQPANEPSGQPRIAETMRGDRKSLKPCRSFEVSPWTNEALYDQASSSAPSTPATTRHWVFWVWLMRGPPSTLRLAT